MNELMIYVERIVRPVRAFASRKLRMRRELLAHLQNAMDEERQSHPDNEAAALEASLRRLGDAAELATQLQRTVPLVERVLMFKLPITRTAERAEVRAGVLLFGAPARLTLGHTALLALLAGPLAGIPCYTPRAVRDVLRHTGTAVHPGPLFVGLLTGLAMMLLVSYRLVFSAAEPGRKVADRKVIRLSVALLTLQIAFQFFVAAAAADRLPTVDDLAVSTSRTLVLLICAVLLSRVVARLRQPYDPWLMLDVAG